MVSLMDYNVKEKPQWCLGCGDFGVLAGVKQALAELGKEPHETVIVSGIGCGSKIPHYIRSYGYEGIHGRALPLAEGIKISNPSLTVIAIGGDGDGFSEGGNHFIHAARRNEDITYIVQDNYYYALTTGQASPTTKVGMKTKTTPKGNRIPEYRPVPMALMAGATFAAATYAGDVKHMKEVLKEAINHKGFAFVECYQPCITWDKVNTYTWYKDHVYHLEDEGHDTSDWDAALKKAVEPFQNGFEKVPVGIFYRDESRPTFRELLNVGEVPLVKQELHNRDISEDCKQLI